MSRTIDERIVEMRFNNEQFQQNIQESIDSLERLKSELDLQESAKGLNKLGKAGKSFSLASVSESVEGIASKFSTMGIVGVTALQNITNSAIAAGKRIVSALTIQPVTTGFNEYELKMDSIKTIMEGSGEDLETVKKYLEELNKYADETIYSFSDMTSSIGKFTNAGVELPDAVSAIKGISNVAALAGANANQASHAMYNFAQALSSGYVKLVDWKSIETAQMSTQGFKDELIKTALELKTIRKLDNGMFETITTDANGKTSEAFDKVKRFNESLAHGWMTSDVLVQTLAKYASTTTDVGIRANAAASEVRTLTKMMDTLKESAQSGWSATWELIVGDMEEATELFTAVSKIIGGLLDTMAKTRNAKLSEWLDLGGKQTVYDAFGYLHNTIIQIGTIIRDSFREFFPASTGKTLLSFTEKFRDAMAEAFKFVVNNKDTIRTIFDGVFSVLKAGTTIIKNVRKAIWNLVKALLPAGEGFLDLVERISDYLIDVSTAIRDSELLEGALRGIGNAVEWVIGAIEKFVGFTKDLFANADMSGLAETLRELKENFNPLQNIVENVSKLMDKLGKAFEWVKKAVGNLADKFKPAFDEISTAIKNADLETLLKWLNLLLTGGLLVSLTSFISSIKRTVLDFGEIFEIFDSLGKLIGSYVFKNLASGMLMIAGALFIIGTIPADKMAATIGIFAGVLGELMVALYALDKLFGKDDAFFGTIRDKATALQKVGVTLALIGVSLLMVASAAKKLSGLHWTEVLTGVGGVLGLLTGFVMVIKTMDLADVSIKTAISMLVISAAISSLARSVKKLGNFEDDVLLKGFASLVSMFALILWYVQTVDEKQLGWTALGILGIAVAIGKLTSVMSTLGDMDIQAYAQGLGGVALLMLTLAMAISRMPDDKKALAGAVGIRVIASALKVVADVISIIGKLEPAEFGIGIAGFLVALGALVAAIALLNELKFKPKETLLAIAGIAALAISLRIVADALVAMENVKWETLGMLGAVVGVLFLLGAAAGFVQPIGIGMLMVAGSIALLGLGCQMAGEGALDFAVAMEKLAVSGRKGGKALADILLSIIEIMPEFAKSAGEAIVEFATAISNGSDAIREALIKVGTSAAAASVSIGFEMVASFLKGIKDGAKDLGKDMKDALIAVLESLSENLPPLIDKATKLIISIMNGMADALEKNNEEFRQASIRLGKQIGDGLVIGLETAIATVTHTTVSMGKAAINGLKEGTDTNSPSREAMKVGGFVGDGLVIGAEKKTGDVYDVGFTLGETAIDGIADGADTHSPSRRAISTGEGIGDGLVIGGLNRKSDVYNTFEELGITSVDALDGFKMDFFNIGSGMAENYNNGLTSGMYAYADPLSGMREMIEKDIEDHKQQDLLDPSLWRMRKEMKQTELDFSDLMDDIEIKTEKTRKEMTTGIGYGINHRLAMGLKLYSEQALKAAEETKEQTLRPITDMSKNFDFDTTKIQNTFNKLASDTSKLSAELDLDSNVTVNHTFDKLTIEGVNNKGEFVAAADYSVEKIITSLMRRQARV